MDRVGLKAKGQVMGDFLQNMGKRAALTVIGVVLCLAYWTFTGSGEGNYTELDKLPEVVFDGGGGTLILDVELNQPGVLKATFSRYVEDKEEVEEESSEDGFYVHQQIDSGKHRFKTDVPNEVYSYFEVGIPNAAVGAGLGWRVTLDGKTLAKESMTLDKPLERGHAFFVQLDFDDIAELRKYPRGR